MPGQDEIFLRAWRVEDEDSMAQFDRRTGAILAKTTRRVPMDERCRNIVLNHLDWSSRSLSPLISVTKNENWAFHEAQRRIKQGKTDVVVHEICVSKSRLIKYKRCGEQLVYRHTFTWLDKACTDLPGCADYKSTDYEYLFLHQIPGIFIVETTRM
ncbi:hypothetical protein P168DRAFT_279194 [Aspergillus campestris IBT 28561]|uniref:DUF7587 domain-containing protein n=1 Tax=Aspergillus campestris (strain IBT 28561) TaxID=1392248 RepID=A0A2I1DBI2_ASPC2|nr:uncharacterized protein P168DRAFT_279194 [Aspergillus campestris IBT 28561]PKY07210.1 hypothetical protein P168DRAFT_279194 [Aspergillus campestris IBT 28561]